MRNKEDLFREFIERTQPNESDSPQVLNHKQFLMNRYMLEVLLDLRDLVKNGE